MAVKRNSVFFKDSEGALCAAERMSALTHMMSSLEFLASKKDQRRGGLNNWILVRKNFESNFPGFIKLLDRLAKEKNETVLHVLRVGAGLSLFLPKKIRKHRAAANLFLSGTSFILYPKHFYGSDGSDQLSFLVQTASGVARLGDDPRRKESALQFLAAQVGLSYFTSGAVKLFSRTWRSGEALPKVLRTRTYGDERLFRFLRRHPVFSRNVAHAVLLVETAFPVIFLVPRRLAVAGVLGMGVFHVLNARYMGLARFVWAFLATYPAVIHVISQSGLPWQQNGLTWTKRKMLEQGR